MVELMYFIVFYFDLFLVGVLFLCYSMIIMNVSVCEDLKLNLC